MSNGINIAPYNADAERTVMSCIFANPENLEKAVTLLQPENFYESKNQTLYRAMIDASKRSTRIDTVMIIEELRKKNSLDLDMVGYINELTSIYAPFVGIENSSKLVYEYSLRREIIRLTREMTALAADPQNDAFEVSEKLQSGIMKITSRDLGGKTYKPLSALAVEAVEYIEDATARRRRGEYLGVPTGFYDIDKRHGGFRPTDFIVIAARPSMGKTALLWNIIRNAAIDYGKRIAFFSLEMSALQLLIRSLAQETGIDLQRLRDGEVEDHEWEMLMEAIRELSKGNVYLDETAALSINTVRARARQMMKVEKLDMIVIDYIGLMNDPDASDSRQEEVSSISRGCKQMAKELNVPVIALSQLNRLLEQRMDKRPQLADLRESGSIEQDADTVLFVHRPEMHGIKVDAKGRSTEGVAEIITAKFRNGAVGSDFLHFDKRRARFMNLKPTDNAPQKLPEKKKVIV